MDHVLQLRHVSKRYRSQKALDDVTLEVPSGVVFALLGENGAGKTPAIRVMLGLTSPDSGESTVLGLDSRKQHQEIRRRVGYVSERPAMYDWMTVEEIGWFAAGFYETGSNKLYIANGSTDDDVLIYGDFSSRKMGIHTVSPSYDLDVNGYVCASGFVQCSDRRLKKDVKPIEKVLDKISRLRGVNFLWKDKEKGKMPQLGIIAQEVESVFPEAVSTDGKGYKSVAYGNLVAPLIEAVKELKAENESLKRRLKALENKMK